MDLDNESWRWEEDTTGWPKFTLPERLRLVKKGGGGSWWEKGKQDDLYVLTLCVSVPLAKVTKTCASYLETGLCATPDFAHSILKHLLFSPLRGV